MGLDSGSRSSYWKKAMAATSAGIKIEGLLAAAAPTPTRGAAIELIAAKRNEDYNLAEINCEEIPFDLLAGN